MLWITWLLSGAFLLPLGGGAWALARSLKLHQRNQEKALFWERLEAQWEPLMARYLQELDAQLVWGNIVPGQELYFIDFLLRYALHHPEQVPELKMLAAPYLDPLASRLRQGRGDAEQRARAVQTLSLLGTDTDIENIALALDDDSPMVTLLAGMALAEHQRHDLLPQILEQLSRISDWHQGILTSLLKRMGESTAAQIFSFLEYCDNPTTQSICLQALTEFEYVPSVTLAVRLLADSEEINVQVACLNLLGKMGEPEHLPLMRQYYDSPYFAVRLAVIRALHQQQSNDQQMYQKAFEDSSRWVALHAAQALKGTGNEHILHELTFMEHPRAKLASQVLNTYDDLEELERAVQQPDFKHKVGMLFQSLESEDGREMQNMIVRLFFKPSTHPEVRYAMACEFERFRNYSFYYQTLSSFVLGSNDQRSLIRALRSFANPESVPALIEYYRGKANTAEKLEIVDALGNIDSMESLEFLSKIYNELLSNAKSSQLDPQQRDLQKRLAHALARKMAI